ncbi:hypothetical protein AB6A40_011562 [Gnathostoma spinigerum]|uniref:Uncharacterized protein n=1 Tax=Gnathostoma spinigerum TaxID=75299 RepID=A0ABD6F3R2_9BILA
MPDISSIDVEYCRQISMAQSPTETLLTIWGAKGNKVTQLYNLLGRIGMVRSMSVLRDRVDPKYHHWEKECQQRNQNMQFDRSCCVAHGLSKSQVCNCILYSNAGINFKKM